MDMETDGSAMASIVGDAFLPAEPSEVKALFRDFLDSLGFSEGAAAASAVAARHDLPGLGQKDA
jgi:hypothetical protein